MKNNVIIFRENDYLELLEIAKDLADKINAYNEKTATIKLSKELIRGNKSQLLQDTYLSELEDICKGAYLDFNQVKLKMPTDNRDYSFYRDIANRKCKPLNDIIDTINNVESKCLRRYYIGQNYNQSIIDFIEQDDKGLFFIDESRLKESQTERTNSEKENKLLDKINNLLSYYKELSKLGLSKRDMTNIIDDSFNINPRQFHEIANRL